MATQQSTLPTRTATNLTDPDDAIPDEDSTETTRLFHERLQAYKHACGYFEDYITSIEKIEAGLGKDYEKHVLKTVKDPLKEGHHFDQNLGGISGLFENIRTNTQGLSNSHADTAKTLKGSVLPIFERLHSEIKSKTKELVKGAGKGAKAVDKARNTSQKHIESLGTQTAAFSSSSGGVKAADDPYVLQRQIYHRLHKQVQEENANRDDMLAVQNNFSTFETHLVQTFQQGLAQFHQAMAAQTERQGAIFGDVLGTAQRIPPDHEWNGFVQRNLNTLIDPNAPKRTVENIGFANQDHQSTKPLIAGSLERKSGMLKKYDTGYYAITPSKYLHEFKSDDDFAKDPSPENSLYLPDCLIGAVDGVKFNVRGKDSSGGTIGNKLAMTKEFAFKAHTPADAQKWHDVIASVAGQSTNEMPEGSAPTSPVESRVASHGTIPPTTTAAPATPAAPIGQAPVGTAATTADATHGVSVADKV